MSSSSEKSVDYDSLGLDLAALDYDKIGAGVDPRFQKTTPEQDEARRKFLQKSQEKAEDIADEKSKERNRSMPKKKDDDGDLEIKKDKEPSSKSPSKKEEKDPTDTKSVMSAVEDIIKNPRYLDIDIYFKSTFSHGNEVSEQILRDMPQDTNLFEAMQEAFDWFRYDIKIDRDIRGFEVKYHFTKDLKGEDVSSKNVLMGKPYKETFTVDGNPVNSEAANKLRAFIENTVLPEGVLPKGAYSVEFHNVAHSVTEDPTHADFTPMSYPGTRFFKVMHDKIFKKDVPHKEWEGKSEKFLDLKKFGPLDRIPGHEKLLKEVAELENIIKNESDPAIKQDQEKKLESLKNKIVTDVEKAQRTQDYMMDRIQDLKRQRKDLIMKDIQRIEGEAKTETNVRKKTEMDDKIKVLKMKLEDMGKMSAMVYAVAFPEPFDRYAAEPRPKFLPADSDSKMLALLDKYGLTSQPNPRGWLTPADLKTLAGVLRSMILKTQEKAIKALKKKTPEAVSSIEKEYKADLDSAVGLFPAFIKNFKDRAESYSKKHPLDYKSFSLNEWALDDQKIEEAIQDVKRRLSEKPKAEPEKQEQITGLEFDSFRQLFGFLDAMKRGFKKMGLRLKKAIVHQDVAGSDILEKYMGAKAILEEIRNEKEKEGQEITNHIKKIEEEGGLSPEDKKLLADYVAEESKISDRLKVLKDKVITPTQPGLKPGISSPETYKETLDTLERKIKSTEHIMKVLPTFLKKYPIEVIGQPSYLKITYLQSALNQYEKLKKELEQAMRVNRDVKDFTPDPELKAEYEDLSKLHKEMKSEIKDIIAKGESGTEKLNAEAKSQLEEIRAELASLDPELTNINKSLASYSPLSPATSVIKSLRPFADFFQKLYNTLSRTVMFREKYEPWYSEQDLKFVPVKSSEVEAAEKQEKTKEEHLVSLTKLKDSVAQEAFSLAKIDIKHADEIKAALKALKEGIRDYLKIFHEEFRGEYILRSAAEDKESDLEKKIEDKEKELKDATGTEKEKLEKELKELRLELRDIQLVQYRIPESQYSAVHRLIEKIKKSENKKIRDQATKAEAELEDIINKMTEAYNKGFSSEQVMELAKKKDIAPKKARAELLDHQEALTKAILDDFIMRWQNVEEFGDDLTPKTMPDVKDDSHIADLVRQTVPGLFKQKKPEGYDDFKIPSAGIPTPAHIREMIEKTFTSEKELSHEDLIDLYKDELKSGGGGGGGGGKGRTRPKVIRPTPPSYAGDLARRATIKNFEGAKSGEDIIDETLSDTLARIQHQLEGLKEDEYMDPQDVINGVRTALFNIYNGMKKIKAFPSFKIDVPPPGAPPYSGSPDIAVDSLKDAQKFLKKWEEAIEEINWYLETDKYTVPKLKYNAPTEWGKPGGKGKDERWLPSGFADWLYWWGGNEGFKFDRSTPHPDASPDAKKWQPIEKTTQPGKEETQLIHEKEKARQIKEEIEKRFQEFKKKFEAEKGKEPETKKEDWRKEYEKRFREKFKMDPPKLRAEKSPEELKKELLDQAFKKEEQDKLHRITRPPLPSPVKSMDLLNYPTQMSMNVASKFIGVDLPDDEVDAVLL